MATIPTSSSIEKHCYRAKAHLATSHEIKKIGWRENDPDDNTDDANEECTDHGRCKIALPHPAPV